MTDYILPKNSLVHHPYPYSHDLHAGALIDVTQIAQLVGIEFRVALTVDVWQTCVKWSSIDTSLVGIYQSEERRLYHLLNAVQDAIAKTNQEYSRQCLFQMKIILQNTMAPALSPILMLLKYKIFLYGYEEEPILVVMLENGV